MQSAKIQRKTVRQIACADQAKAGVPILQTADCNRPIFPVFRPTI
jgi:hypothetical protein